MVEISCSTRRYFKHQQKSYDFVVVGGGMAGVAAAVTAARRGIKVALVQDRSVLGGNASKEIRVWLHGADGGANNAYFRETGLMEELKLENLYWNPDGNAERWHIILHNVILNEPNIDVYLNTVITEVYKDEDHIQSVKGFTLASETWTTFSAPLFADTTGDGSIGYLAGVPYRKGQEAKEEFGERLAPEHYEPYTMGGTIMFLAKDVGHPVEFQRPSWAHFFKEEDLIHRDHSHKNSGIYFWWIEWGGESDSIHDNEEVKYELWRIVYGIWDHLKNAPEHREDTRCQELEWVGVIPGKRESRRLIGQYILTEHDILNQTSFTDAVAYGGWNLDHHPSKGFWDKNKKPAYHFHIPGIYNIPLRSLIAKNCKNLFIAGRNMSATHIAMCSTRVMLTGAQMGEAVGVAAAECIITGRIPHELDNKNIINIQQNLLKSDHYIIGFKNQDPNDLAPLADVTATSTHRCSVDTSPNNLKSLSGKGYMVMFPIATGKLSYIEVLLTGCGQLKATLWKGDHKYNYFPVEKIKEIHIDVDISRESEWIQLPFKMENLLQGWYFIELQSEGISMYISSYTIPGIRLLSPGQYDFSDWVKTPGQNEYSNWEKVNGYGSPCIKVLPEQNVYGAKEIINGFARPFGLPNLWISKVTDFSKPERITLSWQEKQIFNRIQLTFNTNLDLDLRNIWVSYKNNTIATCVRDYQIEVKDGDVWKLLVHESGNYQRFRVHNFNEVLSDQLRVTLLGTWGAPYASIYEIRVYKE